METSSQQASPCQGSPLWHAETKHIIAAGEAGQARKGSQTGIIAHLPGNPMHSGLSSSTSWSPRLLAPFQQGDTGCWASGRIHRTAELQQRPPLLCSLSGAWLSSCPAVKEEGLVSGLRKELESREYAREVGAGC